MAKILVVEEEENVRGFLKDLFDREGHQTTAVGSGKEALDILCTEGGFNLIFIDVGMEVMSGGQLYEGLSHQMQRNVIFMTGGDGQPVVRFKRPIIHKPFVGPDMLLILVD